MKIVLTTTNKAKQEALHKTLEKLSIDAEVVSIKVETGVSNTPITDEEGIAGALNRIENAKKIVEDGDIYIGLEGIITTNEYGIFICGWAVIETRDGKRSMGCSSKVELPEKIAKNISDFQELADEVKTSYPSELVEEMVLLGSNGVITNRLYTRVDEFEDSLMCAFGYLQNKTNYNL